jgi:hypothetical protein
MQSQYENEIINITTYKNLSHARTCLMLLYTYTICPKTQYIKPRAQLCMYSVEDVFKLPNTMIMSSHFTVFKFRNKVPLKKLGSLSHNLSRGPWGF